MDAFTPAQATELMTRIGCKKAKMRPDKLLFNSFMAGALLSFGCAVNLMVEASPWFQTNAPGLIKVVGAVFFPVGLIMIVLTGADLITSNIMFMASALLQRRCTILELLQNWVICYLGNLAGALWIVGIQTRYAGTFDANPYKSFAISFGTTKAVTPQWHQIFLRGIGCNWLVCLAVFMALQAREVVSKMVALWLPIFTFVALGFDHVVANMFFIPLAIFLGNPQITVGYYIWKSMIPSAIGNIIGGVLFTSVAFWYFYVTGTDGISIHFDMGAADTAVYDMSGPGNYSRRPTVATLNESREASPSTRLPDSGGHAKSGLAEELDGEKYGRKASKAGTTGPEDSA